MSRADDSPLSAAELEHFRRILTKRLLQLQARVVRDLHDEMEAPLEDDQARADSLDEATRLDLENSRLRMDERSAALAQAIDLAIGRITRGDYGICVECERPIERERLELVPWTLRCAADQEALESERHAHPPTL
jgi:DnaK suppressor protein